jgi:hypothetical protein
MPNIRVIKPVTCMGRRELHLGVWWGNLKDGGHVKDICTDGRITLERVWKIQDGKVWTGLVWLRIGTSRRFL